VRSLAVLPDYGVKRGYSRSDNPADCVAPARLIHIDKRRRTVTCMCLTRAFQGNACNGFNHRTAVGWSAVIARSVLPWPGWWTTWVA